MSFLTPLYALGLLAVSLPVVFHLIRRMPRGQQTFSSLMFLAPSPPRLSRTARFEHLILLLLRALALTLLAMAFARPFFRMASQLQVDDAVARRIALLVDTSASMQRAGVWEDAKARADRWLADLGPNDDVALFAFDDQTRALVPLRQSGLGNPKQQQARVRGELTHLTPGWGASNLGDALVVVAEELHAVGNPGDPAEVLRQIVLVSDLQEGCRLDAVETYGWPEDVQLVVQRTASTQPGNAGLELAPLSTEETETPGPSQAIRVRIANNADSADDHFELRWYDRAGVPLEHQPIAAHVPAGESRVVSVPRHKVHEASRLDLAGDEHPFDNSLHMVPVRQEVVPVLYVGTDRPDDPQGLCYYLQRAFPETPSRKVHLLASSPTLTRKPDQEPDDPANPPAANAQTAGADAQRSEDQSTSAMPTDEPTSLPLEEALQAARLVVVSCVLEPALTDQMRQYLDDGGTVLVILTEANTGSWLKNLLGRDSVTAVEADSPGYAMLGTVAFAHPLFASFADPRFNDFTNIHFWKHRRLEVKTGPALQVLARFDDGDPALVEDTRFRGRLLVLTSGWHPTDSQLALSTKFVPLISRILETSGASQVVLPHYRISDPVPVPKDGALSDSATVHKPDGSRLQLATDAGTFSETDQPGVYEMDVGDTRRQFAVNVASEESRTLPLEADRLEQLGVQLGKASTRAELVAKERQKRNVELEGQQKFWRWLIAAALGVLIFEIWLAGRLGRPAEQTAG